MKQTIEIEVLMCDFCKKEQTSQYNECKICHKLFCCDCKAKEIVEYDTNIFYSRKGGGGYCNDCHTKLLVGEIVDAKFNLFREIKRLRDLHETFYKSFNVQAKQAEKDLEALEV